MRTLLLLLALALSLPAVSAAQSGLVTAADAADAQTFFERGREHFAEGRIAAASSHFVAALELDPGHRQARAYLVECLVLDDQIDEARDVARGGQSSDAEPLGPDRPAAEQPPLPSDGPPPDLPVLGVDDTMEPVPPPDDPPMPPAAAPSAAPAPPREPAAPAAAPDPMSGAPGETRESPPRTAPSSATRPSQSAKDARRERTARRNPRAISKVAAGVAIGGAAVTVGGFVELRPTWLGAFELGIGGFLVPVNDRVVGAVAFSMEAQFSPIPFRLTPLFGGGLMVLGGSGVSVTEPVLGSLPSVGNSRVVPYGLVGARYDLRKRLWFSVSVRVAPSPRTRVVPLPGARVGLRF